MYNSFLKHFFEEQIVQEIIAFVNIYVDIYNRF